MQELALIHPKKLGTGGTEVDKLSFRRLTIGDIEDVDVNNISMKDQIHLISRSTNLELPLVRKLDLEDLEGCVEIIAGFLGVSPQGNGEK